MKRRGTFLVDSLLCNLVSVFALLGRLLRGDGFHYLHFSIAGQNLCLDKRRGSR